MRNKIIFAVLITLCCSFNAQAATQLISEGYEYADNAAFWAEWTTFGDGRSTISTDTYRSGSKSLKIDYDVNKNVVVSHNFTSSTGEIYLSYYIKLGSSFGQKGFKFARWRGGGSARQTEMWLASSTLYVAGNIYDGGTCGMDPSSDPFNSSWSAYPSLWDNNWHRIEVYTKYSTGVLKIWFDSTLRVDESSINYGSCTYNDVVAPGNMGATESASPNDIMYLDDLEVWDGIPSSNSAPTVSITTPAACPHETSSTPLAMQATASDSDGTIASAHWYNDTTSADGACTANDGSFDGESSEVVDCSVTLQSGSNSIRITATDDDSDVGQDSCTVTYSAGGDYVDPQISITSPASTPHDSSTQSITISGTASDDVALRAANPIVASCPNCVSVGSVTGSTSWSFQATLAVLAGGLGSDLLNGDGDFADSGNWSIETGWTVGGGVITCDGTNNASFQEPFGANTSKTYRVYYEITAYTSGDLYLSQYGFPGVGNSVQLSNSIGSHYVDVDCEAEEDVRFTSVNYIGSVDNVQVKEVGTYNDVTVTAYDTSDNSASDSVLITYGGTPPTMTSGGTVGLR